MKRLSLVLAMVTLALSICSFAVRNASAQNTVLVVQGPTTVDPAISETFSVSIIIENVPEPGFYGWEFYLSWNPALFNCTNEVLNTALWGGNHLGPWVSSPIDNTAGKYHQSLSGKAPGQPEVGTFWLVNLTFRILTSTPTTTEITLSPPAGSTYCIADINAEEIPHDYQNLPVNIVPEFNTPILIILLISSITLISAKKLRKHKIA
jgi:hypothetical protein